MILPHGNNLALALLWTFLGLLIAAGMLLFQTVGYLLAVFALVAVVIGLLASAIYNRTKSKRGVAQNNASSRRGLTVGVRVTQIAGECSRAVPYPPGKVYLFADADAPPPMCGPAVNAVHHAVQEIRFGQPATRVEFQCSLSNATISFDVYPVPKEEAANATQIAQQ